MRRVAITGLGIISPLGLNEADTWEGLVAGRSGAAPITQFDATDYPARFACEVKGFDVLQYMGKKEARRSDRFVHLAMGASEQAIQDAGLGDGLPNPERTGVVIGCGIGGIATFEKQVKIGITKGPSRVSPFFVPMFIPDMAAGLVSIRYGATGPNFCTVSACASSTHAIGEAFRMVQSGVADIIISGGTEAAITAMTVAGFGNMKALSSRNDEPEKASRPFDKGRDGFVLGEGAGIVIVEALDQALERGARIRAELVGYGLSGDAYHITQPAPGGVGAIKSMNMALDVAGIDKSEYGYINSHGTSTPHGDVAEVQAVRSVFGEHTDDMIVGSTKSMTGHLLGAAGGLEGAICVMVLETGVIPPTINQDDPDPECNINCAPNVKVEREVTAALSNSFGFGGHNATLAFKRYTD